MNDINETVSLVVMNKYETEISLEIVPNPLPMPDQDIFLLFHARSIMGKFWHETKTPTFIEFQFYLGQGAASKFALKICFYSGIFAQWVMACGIFCIGLIVFAIQGFPQFYPLAMLGGVFWALGNVTAVPIMNVLGMGMGMLIWGITNCVAGWATGRFGIFINATVPSYPFLNYIGLLLVIFGGCFFSQMRPTPRPEAQPNHHEDEPLLGDGSSTSDEVVHSNRQTKRIIGIVTSLVAGVFYGITFLPVIYIQDHPDMYPGSSKDGLDYVFSHFTGIFITSTAILVTYVIFSNNQPFVNNQIIGPAMLSGTMWGIAQSSWFIANDNLSQSVTFPIISMVPGVCAAVWSVFYFRDIEGRRNLRILVIAVLTTMTGAIFVGISK